MNVKAVWIGLILSTTAFSGLVYSQNLLNINSATSTESASSENTMPGIRIAAHQQNGSLIINSLTKQGPAARSHELHVGDHILAVGQPGMNLINLQGMEMEKIPPLLQGPLGSKVILKVQSAEKGPVRMVQLTRENVSMK